MLTADGVIRRRERRSTKLLKTNVRIAMVRLRALRPRTLAKHTNEKARQSVACQRCDANLEAIQNTARALIAAGTCPDDRNGRKSACSGPSGRHAPLGERTI